MFLYMENSATLRERTAQQSNLNITVYHLLPTVFFLSINLSNLSMKVFVILTVTA